MADKTKSRIANLFRKYNSGEKALNVDFKALKLIKKERSRAYEAGYMQGLEDAVKYGVE